MLTDLPKILELVSGRAELQPPISFISKPVLFTTSESNIPGSEFQQWGEISKREIYFFSYKRERKEKIF